MFFLLLKPQIPSPRFNSGPFCISFSSLQILLHPLHPGPILALLFHAVSLFSSPSKPRAPSFPSKACLNSPTRPNPSFLSLTSAFSPMIKKLMPSARAMWARSSVRCSQSPPHGRWMTSSQTPAHALPSSSSYQRAPTPRRCCSALQRSKAGCRGSGCT